MTDLSKISMSIELITPSVANTLLEANTRNRNFRPAYVRKYSADLLAGRFALNGETIKIAFDGVILDGQNRLKACIETGVSFHTCVVRGLPHEAQDTIDIGAKRTMADALSIHKFTNTNVTAAIANTLGRLKVSNMVSTMQSTILSNSELMEFIEARPFIATASTYASGTKKTGLPHSCVGAVYYIASQHLGLRNEIEEFFNVMKSGIPSYEDDPARNLREKVMKLKLNRLRLDPLATFATACYCFERFIERKPLSNIHWKDNVAIKGFDPKTL